MNREARGMNSGQLRKRDLGVTNLTIIKFFLVVVCFFRDRVMNLEQGEVRLSESTYIARAKQIIVSQSDLPASFCVVIIC